jgi:hypothetical protein
VPQHDRLTRVAALVAAAVAVGYANTAAAQTDVETPSGRLRWTIELGVTAGTPLVEDGNGVTVRAAVGPILAGGLSIRLRPGVAMVTGVRLATSGLRVESNDDAWHAGRVGEYAATVGVELQPIPSIALAASLLGARLTGPSDVIPFRSGALSTWGTDVAGYVHLSPRVPLELAVGASFFRLPGQTRETLPLDGGWAGQVRIGVRHVIR